MIGESHRANFAELCRAFELGDVALVEVAIAETGERRVALAAIGFDPETETYAVTPFALMVEGNPFEELEPFPEPEPAT